MCSYRFLFRKFSGTAHPWSYGTLLHLLVSFDEAIKININEEYIDCTSLFFVLRSQVQMIGLYNNREWRCDRVHDGDGTKKKRNRIEACQTVQSFVSTIMTLEV